MGGMNKGAKFDNGGLPWCPGPDEVEMLKASVLELADAFRETAYDEQFSYGYRDGCMVASRDFKALIEHWDEIKHEKVLYLGVD